MRTDLDHLPERQQRELAHVTRRLLDGFEKATARASQSWCRNGKVFKVILFGSYARDDWVDEPENGYQSDFDLLVIVSHPDLTDTADYWYEIEEKLLRDRRVGRLVNIIVHTLDEVNSGLVRGEYFWTDIARDGIALHELPDHPLATPRPLTPVDACEMANRYYRKWLKKTNAAIKGARSYMLDDELDDAAFTWHQATERAYTCFLLVSTFYVPRSHNIKFLRSLAEDREPRLIPAWPRTRRSDKRLFEKLKRAYVDSRYADPYEISVDELEAFATRVKALRDLVDNLCCERLDALRHDAGLD